MKKKSLVLLMLILIVSMFSLTACDGIPSSDGEEEQTTQRTSREKAKNVSDNEDDDEKNDDEKTTSKKDKKNKKNKGDNVKDDSNNALESFYGVVSRYEAGEWYNVEASEEYSLSIIDDVNCQLVKYMKYDDNYNSNAYSGVYEKQNNCYCVYTNDGFDDICFYVYIDGEEIVKVVDKTNSNEDFAEILGSHSIDSEYGLVEFEVDEDGLVDNCIYLDGELIDTANLFKYDYDGPEEDNYDPEWDLTFSIGDDIYCDWYLYFNKRGVSYEPYRTVIYGKYAGTYEMDGQLGVITVEADDEGNAWAEIKIDGEVHSLSGSVGYDSYYEKITFDLFDDTVSMYLYVDEFDSGDMYTGSYTVRTELAAG